MDSFINEKLNILYNTNLLLCVAARLLAVVEALIL